MGCSATYIQCGKQLQIFFYFISLSQSCQTTAGIRATNTNVDSASLVFSPGQRYLRQIVFNNVKLLNFSVILLNKKNQISGPGSVQWGDDLVLLCASRSSRRPGIFLISSDSVIGSTLQSSFFLPPSTSTTPIYLE